jgi:acyl-CoA synthetase (AMP-forming)/AMP-acid ligase II
VLTGLRPDKYVRLAAALRRAGTSPTVGIALSAIRCPDRLGLIDERGALTYRQLDARASAFAAALEELSGLQRPTIAVMCRNHRGFVDALTAANRIGADVLLLNTSFSGPALAAVVAAERPDIVVYDEEFDEQIDHAVTDQPQIRRIVAWCEGSAAPRATVDGLIEAHAARRPTRPRRGGRLILLTSGTTGSPKGAQRSGGGGASELAAVLDRVPWRAEETTVVAAPLFHAWGYGQLVLGSLMSCTVVVRRKFDAAATLAMIADNAATGLCVVPVMLDRIIELPQDVLDGRPCTTLRFVTASGSRMRGDVVIRFMDRFGEVIYNNYNATEVGMIATASPADLRAAPDTAGRPLAGVKLAILDDCSAVLPAGQTGRIFARTSTHFDGYTSGDVKDIRDGYMASGDVGYVDDTGLLFVVGRDDEMIVSGGENIYPIEVEKTLIAHPGVKEATVLGVVDERFGERLVAFVVVNLTDPVNADTLKQHVRDHLATYKVPRQVVVLDELPRNNTGKILRAELRALAGPVEQLPPGSTAAAEDRSNNSVRKL